MAEFESTVPSTWDRSRTFAYMADFRGVQEWDPSISEARLVAGEAGAVGARYEVTMSMAGKETTIPYTAIEVEPAARIVMRGETDSLVSLDTITVSEDDRGVEVTYRAEVTLKGVRKVADPLVGIGLGRAGEKAAAGLTEKLAS